MVCGFTQPPTLGVPSLALFIEQAMPELAG